MAMYVARGCRQFRLIRSPLVYSSKDLIASKVKNGVDVHSARFLFSQEVLKVTNFVDTRQTVLENFRGIQDQHRQRMQFYVDNPDKHMIFTDDLKNFIHIMENTSSDIALCFQMIDKFNNQNKELRFGTYQFGPVVMRMLHFHGLHEEAFQLITNPTYESFFERLTSYIIAMDLLYENGMYDKVLKVSEIVKKLLFYGCKYPKDSTLLVAASCYHQNTKESYEYVLNVLKEVREASSAITGKTLCFIAALAVKQNNPMHTIEVTSSCAPNFPTVRNLKLIALAELNRFDDAFIIIKTQLSEDRPRFSNQQFLFEETLSVLEAAVMRDGNKEFINQMKQIEKAVRERDWVLKESLEDALCQPVVPLPDRNDVRQSRPLLQKKEFNRRGLFDME